MAAPYVTAPQSSSPGMWQSIFTWILTVAVCAYTAWSGITLYRSAGAFADLYASMNVQLPALTSFVIHNYQWFCPALFGGAFALVIAKQFFIRDKWQNLIISSAAVVLVIVVTSGMVQALYLPIEKFNR